MTAPDLQVLQAGPTFELRRSTEPAPELGGAVIVRGLMASEAFALSALRTQALQRVRAARVQHEQRVAEMRERHDERCAALPPGVTPPPFEEPDWKAPQLTFDELQMYGRHQSELLARAVVNAAGLQLYTADQWEVQAQHHPGLVARLTDVAERLSGLQAEAVQKKIEPTLS